MDTKLAASLAQETAQGTPEKNAVAVTLPEMYSKGLLTVRLLGLQRIGFNEKVNAEMYPPSKATSNSPAKRVPDPKGDSGKNKAAEAKPTGPSEGEEQSDEEGSGSENGSNSDEGSRSEEGSESGEGSGSEASGSEEGSENEEESDGEADGPDASHEVENGAQSKKNAENTTGRKESTKRLLEQALKPSDSPQKPSKRVKVD